MERMCRVGRCAILVAVLAGCKNVDDPPTPAAIAGTWLYHEILADNLYDVTCVDTGTYTFTQDGGKVGGMFVQTGKCTSGGSQAFNDGHGLITDGTVTDVRVQFTAADLCTYTGLLTPARDAVTAGTGVCDFVDSSTARHYSLAITWDMARQ